MSKLWYVFCYYEQFLAELKRLGLTLNDFLGKFYDENNTNLTLQVNSLNVKSILTKYGYSVSKQKGLSSAKRYQILSFIIDKNIIDKNNSLILLFLIKFYIFAMLLIK